MKKQKLVIKVNKKLACALGLHAWSNGVCVNCGKRK